MAQVSNKKDIVYVSPYVASAIIEHAKRRSVAAGYVLGTRDEETIHVVDYFPMTHSDPYADPASHAYNKEREARHKTKQNFTKMQVLGWYSAGTCPADLQPEQFRLWGEMPSYTFASKAVARQALYIHCALPEQGNMSVRWAAYITSNHMEAVGAPTPAPTGAAGSAAGVAAGKEKTGATEKVRHVPRCERVKELTVSISAFSSASANAVINHVATNVVLDHVAAMALYGGKKSYDRSNLLNLDTIAYEAAKLPMPRPQPQQQQLLQSQNPNDVELPQRPLETVLAGVHNRLEAVIRQAKVVAGGHQSHSHGGANSNAAPLSKAAAEELLKNLETIRSIREAEVDQQSTNSVSREDANTQRFKDALMLKCLSVMLRREVSQIERLSHDYQDAALAKAAAAAAGAGAAANVNNSGGNNHNNNNNGGGGGYSYRNRNNGGGNYHNNNHNNNNRFNRNGGGNSSNGGNWRPNFRSNNNA